MSLIPAEIDATPRPLDHLPARGDAAAVALTLKSGRLTYRELEIRTGQIAGWLVAQGLEPGDRVASWLAKGELAALLPLAAARSGAIHVPINPLLKPRQAAHILSDSGARLLIANAARLASLEEQGGDWRRVDEAACGAESLTAPPLPPSTANPEALAALLYTSGSTGLPKGVMLSHANLWLGAVSVANYLALMPEDKVLAVLPFAFDYGQNQLLSTWYAGGEVVPLDYLTPRDVVKAVARHDITTLAGVPPLWIQLTEQDWGPAGASLRRLTNSGGALTPRLVSRLRALFPQARLHAMYGLTEAFRSTSLDPALIDTHPTAMGVAIPFAEIMVVTDDGIAAKAGEEGELVHAGPLVAQGYWRDPVRTAERFRPAPPHSVYGGTAVWSGDRVRRDDDGLLYFAGRRDAMIKTSGNRVSPEEIEEAAIATGLVVEAVAFGVPDERLGEAVHLAVAGDPARGDDLRAALSQALPRFMQPAEIHWLEALPRTPNGKFDRTAIARMGQS